MRHPIWLLINSLIIQESAIKHYREYLEFRREEDREIADMDGSAGLLNLLNFNIEGIKLVSCPPVRSTDLEQKHLDCLFQNYKITFSLFKEEAKKYSWDKESPLIITGFNPRTDLNIYPESLIKKLDQAGFSLPNHYRLLSKSV